MLDEELTPQQRTKLIWIATYIGYSAHHEGEEDCSGQLRQGVVYRRRKIVTTMRIDADVLAWLKSPGRGYQTRINKILRDAMQNSRVTSFKSNSRFCAYDEANVYDV